MRHGNYGGKLGRTSAHRKALFRNMVTSLLDHERIETTDAKAKEIRRIADRMITLGKDGSLHARRRALRVIRTRDVASKLFGDLADRFRARPGGYTRVIKSRVRVGDAAPMSIVELVQGPATPEKPKKGGKKPTTKTTSKADKSAAKTPKPTPKADKKAPAQSPKRSRTKQKTG
jgi:large subunit ribosomal protein L17